MPTTRKLYDSIFKKILTLSSKAVINMINGLFNMFYDPETQQYLITGLKMFTIIRIL